MKNRKSSIERNTLETNIAVEIDLDGSGFLYLILDFLLEHMLDQVARHGMIDLSVKAEGDLHIDAHHTVEDIGITFGQALSQAVGIRKVSIDMGILMSLLTRLFLSRAKFVRSIWTLLWSFPDRKLRI